MELFFMKEANKIRFSAIHSIIFQQIARPLGTATMGCLN